MANVFSKGPERIDCILEFAGSTGSATTVQLCGCSTKAASENTEANGHGCVPTELFTKTGKEPATVCKPHFGEKVACSSAESRFARTEPASGRVWETVESLRPGQGWWPQSRQFGALGKVGFLSKDGGKRGQRP